MDYLDKERFTLEQSKLHEQKTNKVVGMISLGLSALFFFCQILYMLDYSPNVLAIQKTIVMPISVLMVVSYFIARHYDFKGGWIKYMLVCEIAFLGTGIFFAFAFYASYFVLLPLIISTRYFNRMFVLNMSILTAALFITACVINMTIGIDWDILMFNHNNNQFYLWENPLEVAMFIVIPLGLTAVFVAVYSVDLTKDGRALLEEQAGAAFRITAVETELNMAASIQKSALPKGSFTTPDGNFILEAREVTAKEVGGDFYDYFMLNDHTLAVLIADVSDKGVPAAMFMMSAKKAIRCAAECCGDFEEAIQVASRLICDDNENNMFLTLWLGVIDTQTGIGKYVNAGHPLPLIRDSEGKTRFIDNEPDLFLGCFKDQCPMVHTFSMKEGDTLLLYTDGVTDAMNEDDESFGEKRVEKALIESEEGALNIVDYVMEQSSAFAKGQEQFDDMTLLVLQCAGTEELVKVAFDEEADDEGIIRVTNGINEFLASLGCPEEFISRVDVVLDEICANIMIHGYCGEMGSMKVEAEGGRNFIRIIFTDSGRKFNPLERKEPEFGDEPLLGGLGIYLVKNIADNLSYRYIDGYNELTVEMIWGI